jgi:hypothetical protein
MQKNSKKCIVEHLEDGYVGSNQIGHKQVKNDDKDITLVRFCWKNKRNNKKLI